jgi:hypothetical protein
MLLQLRRWLPQRTLIVVADSSFAVISLLWRLTHLPRPLCLITRLRLDAALYDPAPKRHAHQKGRPRVKGQRLPTLAQIAANAKTHWHRLTVVQWYGQTRRTLEIVSGTAVWRHSGQPVIPIRWVLIRDPVGKFKTQALLCTESHYTPAQIVKWFAWRWQVEVTFHEVREHLGVETQRQWSDLAIQRTTPALLALFSLVTLLAHHHVRRGRLPIRQAAWYHKSRPTFSDALAVVRQHLWQHLCFDLWLSTKDSSKSVSPLWNRLIPALSYTP